MKVQILLDHSEVKNAVAAWLSQEGYSVGPSASFEIDVNGNVAVQLEIPPHVLKTPAPQPVLPQVPEGPLPGHFVTADPPLSCTGKATMFGLDWNGAKDPTDNQIGFFTDPTTGRPFDTSNKSLRGFSLPREVLMSTFGITDAWKPFVSDHATTHIWDQYASQVREYALKNRVTATLDSGGKTAKDLILVDAGPAGSTGHAIDLTYAPSHELNTQGEALATFQIFSNGIPLEIKGWDHSKGCVG